MSRKNSEDSSLELLLDTMCNTFGGVMFIAILLSVMISIKGHEKNEPVPDPKEKIAEVKAQLTKLRQELSDAVSATREQAKLLENMKSDPRLRLIHEIALLERMHKEKILSQKLTAQKVNLSKSLLKDQQIKTIKTLEEEKKTKEIVKELQKQLKEKKEKLAKLEKKIGSMNLRNMVFITMIKKESAPYFILLGNGKVNSVGPEISKGSFVPNQAVAYEIQSGRVVCRPLPEKEISIFAGGGLSQEFQLLLKNIPSDRVPVFVISRDDASEFYRLREILKKQKVFHGFQILASDQTPFYYQISNKDKPIYEY